MAFYKYSPFGLEQGGSHRNGGSSSDRYKYNGKELDETTGWYDYGARYYDPTIARWGQVDPLAEEYSGYSPYNYVLGNPIRLIDPDGMRVDNTIFVDADGNKLYETKDNLPNAVVVVSNDKRALFLAASDEVQNAYSNDDSDIGWLRSFGDSYYTGQFDELWNKGAGINYGGGKDGYSGYKLEGKGWNPEVSVRLLPDGQGGMTADWEWFKDHKDPETNINVILENQVLVHTHPVNAGLMSATPFGWNRIPQRSSTMDGGGPSIRDYQQARSSDSKGRFNVVVSRDHYHFYNNNATFSVPKSFFKN